jgi:hypothetical protein
MGTLKIFLDPKNKKRGRRIGPSPPARTCGIACAVPKFGGYL